MESGTSHITTGSWFCLFFMRHRYGVKGGIGSFEAAARKSGADIALYGHTHIQYHDTKDGLHILNPGALMNGKYAVLTIEGSISIELKGM